MIRHDDSLSVLEREMLFLLSLLFIFAMVLIFLMPIAGVSLLIIGVVLYHFTIGYCIEFCKAYKELQNQHKQENQPK